MQRRGMATLIGALLCVGGLGACSDITNPNSRSAAATYSLQTVNGFQLPFTFNDGSSVVSIQGDTYVVSDDGSYSEITNETVSDGFQTSNVSDTEFGTWSQRNSTITFRPTSSTRGSFASYTGQLDGFGTLRIAVNGTVSVYFAQ
jgi:hypothetical protein